MILVVVSQLCALALCVGATVVVRRRQMFDRRHRLGVLFVLGIGCAIHAFSLLGDWGFAELRLAWRLRQEGTATMAKILSSQIAGRYSRRYLKGHRNWDRFYDAVCEYRDRQGTRFTGLAELTPSMPHAAGDLVEVRYLPSDPEVMREAYYVAVAKEPDSGLVRGAFPWVVNAGVLLYLLRKSRAQLSRAAAIAAYSADPRTRIR